MRTIPSKETLTVEFKSDIKRLPDSNLLDEIVAMANTDGGTLYLGVEDDGSITGVHQAHADEIGITALIANRTVPSVSVRAELIDEEGKNVLKLLIPRSSAVIATSDGKILRRRLKLDGQPECIPMYPYEIPSRLSTLSLLDYSAQILSNATLDDFDPNERQRLKRMISLRNGDKSLLSLTDEELDKALRLVKDDNGMLRPTVTGLLLIGREKSIAELLPSARASFQVLQGSAVRKNEETTRPLLAVFELFEDYLSAWNTETEMKYGLFQIAVPDFSVPAFREGLVNAFAHRDYTLLQSIRVAIEDDGLVISSPGGFIDGVNLDNLLTVEPHGRNPALSDALKRAGLAEKTGRGIDRIYEGSIIYGRPLPDYSESNSSLVKLFLQRAEPDMPFAKMIADEENRLGRSLPIYSLMILSLLRTNRRMTLRELTEALHINDSRVRANVEKLVESGLIEPTGSGRSRSYILSFKVYMSQENAASYVRQAGIPSVKHEALVEELARRQSGYVTRDNAAELLNITPSQAYRLLKGMVDKGKLELEGSGRGARYRLKET